MSPEPPRDGAMALVRYSLFNSVVLLIAAYAVFFGDGIQYLWQNDATHVSLACVGIYVLVSLYLGVRWRHPDLEHATFFSERATGLGLIGTIVGIILLMHAIGAVGAGNPAAMVAALIEGMSTVLLTTAAGVGTMLLIDLEVWFVFGIRRR